MKRKTIVAAAGLLTVALSCTFTASAASFAPYYSYEYNDFDESVDAPVGYVPSAVITGASLGLPLSLNAVTDMFCDNAGSVYLLDSGNSRILVVDQQFKLQKVIDRFADEAGTAYTFNEAQGLTVGKDGRMYIADSKAFRVLIVNRAGLVERVITRPDGALKNTDAAFDVQKVLLDKDGKLYVSAKSINLGLFVFSPQGEFLQFWGANEVPATGQALLNYLRKRFLTQIQLEAFMLATPVTVSNFDVDKDGFIYTLSPYKTDGTVAVPGLLRKLNFRGEDTLEPSLVFGDTEWDRKPVPLTVRTWFGDVDVDADGFVNLLDTARGRIFQYTDTGQLISVFGALGDQTGCFQYPSAIESVGNKIYAADSRKNVIYEFSPTEYVKTVRSAVQKMNRCDLDGSLEEWRTILSKNTNSRFAYKGIGRVYDAQGDYKEAMSCYRQAFAREDYSKSFQQYRTKWLEAYYPAVLAAAAGLVILLIAAARLIRKYGALREGEAYSRLESKYAFPIYTLFHPTDGFAQFRTRGNQSMLLAALLVLLWIIGMTLRFFFTGPAFNENRPIDYSLGINLMQTAGVYVLFVIANWAVCTLMDGKGSLKSIGAATSYALLPYIVTIFINVGLSNILARSESVFMGMVTALGVVWSLFILFCGLYSIHQYSFLKTLVSVILTVVGMLLLIFLLILFFSLLQQTGTFIESVYKEALLRI